MVREAGAWWFGKLGRGSGSWVAVVGKLGRGMMVGKPDAKCLSNSVAPTVGHQCCRLQMARGALPLCWGGFVMDAEWQNPCRRPPVSPDSRNRALHLSSWLSHTLRITPLKPPFFLSKERGAPVSPLQTGRLNTPEDCCAFQREADLDWMNGKGQ